jgi:hypothetical protein
MMAEIDLTYEQISRRTFGFTRSQVERIDSYSFFEWKDALSYSAEHMSCRLCRQQMDREPDSDLCPCGFILYSLSMELGGHCRVFVRPSGSERCTAAVQGAERLLEETIRLPIVRLVPTMPQRWSRVLPPLLTHPTT